MRRRRIAGFAVTGFVLIAAPAVSPAPAILVWNATPSAPTGLYRARGGAPEAGVGDYVLFDPDPEMSAWITGRGYLPAGVPLIKTVAAMAHTTVCRRGVNVTVDGRFAAVARTHDRQGRPLPVWTGCRRLAGGELFLLNSGAADSLDGRYFGPVSAHRVRARLVPIATRAAPE